MAVQRRRHHLGSPLVRDGVERRCAAEQEGEAVFRHIALAAAKAVVEVEGDGHLVRQPQPLEAQARQGSLSRQNQRELQRLRDKDKGKSTKGFDRNLAQSIDSIKAKIGWLGRDASDVEMWLKENKYL